MRTRTELCLAQVGRCTGRADGLVTRSDYMLISYELFNPVLY